MLEPEREPTICVLTEAPVLSKTLAHRMGSFPPQYPRSPPASIKQRTRHGPRYSAEKINQCHVASPHVPCTPVSTTFRTKLACYTDNQKEGKDSSLIHWWSSKLCLPDERDISSVHSPCYLSGKDDMAKFNNQAEICQVPFLRMKSEAERRISPPSREINWVCK